MHLRHKNQTKKKLAFGQTTILLKNVLEKVRKKSPDVDDRYYSTSKIMVTTWEDDSVVLTPQRIRQRHTLTRKGLLDASQLLKASTKSASVLVRQSVLKSYEQNAEDEKLIRGLTANKTRMDSPRRSVQEVRPSSTARLSKRLATVVPTRRSTPSRATTPVMIPFQPKSPPTRRQTPQRSTTPALTPFTPKSPPTRRQTPSRATTPALTPFKPKSPISSQSASQL